MNVVFTLGYTGTPDEGDVRAARHIVFLENAHRAALTPPGAVLPTANAAQIKASYLEVLLATVTAAHVSYIEQSATFSGVSQRLTLAQLQQVFANITLRLNAGEAADAIVADTAS